MTTRQTGRSIPDPDPDPNPSPNPDQVSLHSGVWHEEALSPSESVDEYVPIEVNATEP